MANNVQLNVNGSIEVKHRDLEVEIRNNEGKLGTVLISKGNIEWLPKGRSVNKVRMSWARFAEFMSEHGRPVKARR